MDDDGREVERVRERVREAARVATTPEPARGEDAHLLFTSDSQRVLSCQVQSQPFLSCSCLRQRLFPGGALVVET